MEFGIYVTPNPLRVAEEARLAEERGFTHLWFADDPMLGAGDLSTCMALAATATRKIKLCAGIAAASNRIAPVIANSIATINALAPGRVILGFGSGAGTLASLGLPALRVNEVRKRLEVTRGLLRNGESIYEANGLQRRIRFFNQGLEFTRLRPEIPIYVAAAAPKMAALAGELADGLINFGPAVPELVTGLLKNAAEGARRAARNLSEFSCVWILSICVLRPDETAESQRVVNRTGSGVLATLKILAGLSLIVGDREFENAPLDLRQVLKEYAGRLSGVTKDELHLELFEDIYTLPTEQRRFVTPEAIRTTALVGPRDEVITRIKTLENAGATQIVVFPGFDGFREFADEISDELIGRL